MIPFCIHMLLVLSSSLPDLYDLLMMAADGPTKTYAFRRLEFLENKFKVRVQNNNKKKKNS